MRIMAFVEEKLKISVPGTIKSMIRVNGPWKLIWIVNMVHGFTLQTKNMHHWHKLFYWFNSQISSTLLRKCTKIRFVGKTCGKTAKILFT